MEIFLIKTLQFLMAISLLVLLHEMGHFFFAKLFKVRVNKFYLFFNPKFHILSTYDTWVRRLLKLKPEVVPSKEVEETDDKGKVTKTVVKDYVGTEYGLGWLPLGGYCAIDGMIDETNQKLSEETHPWEFRVKPTWQRLRAGPVYLRHDTLHLGRDLRARAADDRGSGVQRVCPPAGLPGRRRAALYGEWRLQEVRRRPVPYAV